MGDDVVVMDLYTGAMLAGAIIVSLSIAVATWSVQRAIRRLEERLASHLVHQIREELTKPNEHAEEDLSQDVLELSDPIDGKLLESGGRASDRAKQEKDEPSVEEVLSSMARIIHADKKKQRSERMLTERLGRQISDELAKLEGRKTDQMAVQYKNELDNLELEKLDYEQETNDDPSMKEIISKMKQVAHK